MSDTRKCESCENELPADQFTKRGKGVSKTCKECVRVKGAATREKKKIDAKRQEARDAFNAHWRETGEKIESFDLSQLSELVKEYQKQIRQLQS
jgi:ribosome-binding protein aMBF1 (putative translation factor)